MRYQLAEIDWVLSENLVFALQVEKIARRYGFAVEDFADDCASVRMLLQLRAAGLS